VKRKEKPAAGMRRIAREQLGRAQAELTAQTPASAEAIHQARKRLKKVRALLRLVQPALRNDTFKTQNRRLRDMGHTLAGRRDADVMLETLDGLEQELRERGHDIDLSALRETLRARRDARESADTGTSGPPGQAVAQALAEMRAEAGHWSLAGTGYAALGPGFRKYYRRGRKALRRARRRPGDVEFHEWRKRVKDHWYHSRLLRYLWPRPMRARAGELKILSDLLGDDHDLAVFRQTLQEMPDFALPPRSARLLQAAIRDRQRTLRSSALTLGRRVYAEKPGHFHRRFQRYARAARP
jgi:CHAD domain-containing protein